MVSHYIMRIKFKKGQQRKFLLNVLKSINSPSLRELSRRIEFSYSSLKNYFTERRILPENLFRDLCFLVGMSEKNLKITCLGDNWGQQISRRKNDPAQNRTAI